MNKLSTERRWYLNSWSSHGWSLGHMGCYGKKWDHHRSQLIKAGYLEEQDGLFRITDAGRSALTQEAGR